MKKNIFIFWTFSVSSLFGQFYYDSAYTSLSAMLTNSSKYDFKEAVFITENVYFDNTLSKGAWKMEISRLKYLAELFRQSNELDYSMSDKAKIEAYASIFRIITDTITLYMGKEEETFFNFPFEYNFSDVFGTKDWSNMFVSNLMDTKSGNCHSMPYLYKILCDEFNVPCHLALAPNHIYIKHRAEKGGWYNVELTSSSFPTDAWLMASGYISLESVQKGIYLDTLSEKESIALCVIDLAMGYNHKYPGNDGTFVIKCCDLALQHFPDYVNAILLKAETRLKQLQAMQKQYGYAYLKEVTKLQEGKKLWDEMNSLYMQLYQLSYRQMPEQMYVEWLTSLKTEKEKYTNKQVEQMNRN